MIGICASETMSLAWDDEGSLFEWGTRFKETETATQAGHVPGSTAAVEAGALDGKAAASQSRLPVGAAHSRDEDEDEGKAAREFEMAQIVLPGLAVGAPRDSVRRMVVQSALSYLAAGSGVRGGGTQSQPGEVISCPSACKSTGAA